MIVMKFGGTSIDGAAAVERVVRLIQERVHRQPVVIVSALGKTTRKLLRAAERAASGDASAGLAQLDELRRDHAAVTRGLETTAAGARVDAYFDEIRHLLGGLSILRELTLRGRDRIASYGELISSTIVAEALKRVGVSPVWLDAREFIVTDENYTRARPLFEITNARIVERLRPCVQAGRVPVTQGYIGSTRHGATTTLGFEGSDYTAAIVGAALEAEDIQIWTDVSGIMTADPALLPEAHTVKVISFAEAKELTHFGAKVLHPSTLFPAHEKAIPVHIYNSKRPDGPGTTITTAAPQTQTPVKSIAYKEPVSLVRITSNSPLPPHRFFKAVFEALERTQLVPYTVMTSESSLLLAVDPSEMVERLMTELNPEAQVTVTDDQAIVCLVGERLNQRPGFAGEVFQALKDMRFSLVSQGASEHSLVLMVQATEVKDAVRRLHDVLFQNLDSENFS